MINAIVTDIEGTVTPIRFVTETLYPYARQRIPDFLRDRADDPEVQRIMREVREEAGRELDSDDIIAQLIAWMDADRKVAPLKDLQGMIWEQGYRDGSLVTDMYEDAARRLREWHDRGIRLYVFSSGSVQAQKLIFAHTNHGDLGPVFSGYFDTRIGHKRDAAAYRAIAESIGVAPNAILFLSDVRQELDAAREAGIHTHWLVRDHLPPGPVAHRRVRGFDDIRPEHHMHVY
ncbi:acireductone synthase [Thioalkalivibrio denitrificans]|uniref:Enolase-phosphatase E1 n=1 Tax=Thioalkalivibrio denitrificans TaxID=108003 RepID=A0A1V3NUE9_9GAMM|nr:acireductone synthase [Thioalkalivibrio denitrificans]OOG28745.1 acireductone synthase [Thioalkalivibrio denitrificans]